MKYIIYALQKHGLIPVLLLHIIAILGATIPTYHGYYNSIWMTPLVITIYWILVVYHFKKDQIQ